MTFGSTHDPVTAPRPSRRSLSPLLTIRAVQVVLWLLVVSGPVVGLIVASRLASIGDRLDRLAATATVEAPPDTSGVEGFAELFVGAYLGAGEDSTDVLDPFMDGATLDAVPTGSWSAISAVSLGAEELSPGYFAVTVAAQLIATDSEPGASPVSVRYFSVGVAETGAGWVVTGPPALVSAPPRGPTPELLVDRFDGLGDAPGLDEMLPRFLAAYLTGVGELPRYTSPSASIVAVHPPPFTRVEVLRSGVVETPDGTEVAVVVEATDGDGRGQVLEYALMVEQRDGRWEVSELLPAPSLAPSS